MREICFPGSSKGAVILFRKLYKEANECIHGDRAIIDRAFEAAEKPEKKKSNVFKFSAIGTAAAAVIIAGAVFAQYEIFMKPAENMIEQSTEAGLDAGGIFAAESAFDEEAEIISEPEADDTRIEPRSADGDAETLKEAKKSEESLPEEISAPSEAVREVELKEDTAAVNDAAAEEDDGFAENGEMFSYYSGSSAVTGASGGGARSMKASLEEETADSVKTVNYSAEEYFEYISFDVSKLSLPEGLSFNIEEEYTLSVDDDGNLLGDTVIFTASDGERYVSLMTSRLEVISRNAADGENVSVTEEGEYISAYITKNGAYLTLTFVNVPRAEADGVIGQILND